MLPDLLSIGPVTIHTYGILVALGFATAFLLTVRLSRSYGLGFQQVVDMGLIGIVAGVVGSRLLFVLLNYSHFLTRPVETLKLWDGGMLFSGGLIAVAGAMLFYSRKHGISFLRLGDLWAPGVALGQALGRIGCFMAGCCYGKTLDAPWSIIFTHPDSLAPLNIPLHPTQLYSVLSGFLIAIILLALHKRRSFEGRVLLWFLILHSTGLLLVERFRSDNRNVIPGTEMGLSQLIALVLLIVSVGGLMALTSKRKAANPLAAERQD
ncbi:MAG: prolipoprotein diacylglyceryl transferase [Desulfobacteraceae bacterium]|nr:MAG: prolipoprotein diacylglyceryl transferase [Desulfobacteraceae bacterium]